MSEFPKNTEQIEENNPDNDNEKSGGKELVFLALGFSALALMNSQIEYGGGFGKYRTMVGFKDGSIAEQVVNKIEDFITDEDGNTIYSTPDGNGGTVDFIIEDDTPREGRNFSEPTSENGEGIDFSFLEDENIPYGTPEIPEK